MLFEITVAVSADDCIVNFSGERDHSHIYGTVCSETLNNFGWQNKASYAMRKKEIDDFFFVPFKQDFLPDWYDYSETAERVISAVKEWAKFHIHIGVNNLIIDRGKGHIILNCTNVVINGGSVDYIGGFSHILGIGGDAHIHRIADDVVVKMISDSALVSGYVGDFAKIEYVTDNAQISELRNEALIKELMNNAKVYRVIDKATIHHISNNAAVGV